MLAIVLYIYIYIYIKLLQALNVCEPLYIIIVSTPIPTPNPSI